MSEQSAIILIPLIISSAAIVFRNLSIMTKIIPLLLWLYFSFLVFLFVHFTKLHYILWEIAPGLAVNRISFCFILLTVFVTASSLSHAEVFFEKELSREENRPSGSHIRQFYFLSILFTVAMIIVYLCQNLGFLWMSIEATTLLSAGLVYFQRTKHALEATWKYFIICSVGIAFAFLGTVLIFASSQSSLQNGSLSIPELIAAASHQSLNLPLFKLGFIFAFLGFATKAGIFPLHSWLPDAHSEAPAPASAMLSGALLNCALFAIYRILEIADATGRFPLAREIALWTGTITVFMSGIFLVRQHGLKRLWAYSSVENSGIMLVAISLGATPLFFLQAVNHSLAKITLFLLAGNIVQSTGTKELKEMRGLFNKMPAWSILMCLAALAVTGTPPFGAFISEWLILICSFNMHKIGPLILLMIGLSLSFIAIFTHLGQILFGTGQSNILSFRSVRSSVVPAVLILCSFILGFLVSPDLLTL